MTAGVTLIAALLALIWFRWDWFTGSQVSRPPVFNWRRLTDEEIEHFFEEEKQRGAGG